MSIYICIYMYIYIYIYMHIYMYTYIYIYIYENPALTADPTAPSNELRMCSVKFIWLFMISNDFLTRWRRAKWPLRYHKISQQLGVLGWKILLVSFPASGCSPTDRTESPTRLSQQSPKSPRRVIQQKPKSPVRNWIPLRKFYFFVENMSIN